MSRAPTTSLPGPKVLLVCAVIVVALAGVAAWQMFAGKPHAGEYIDALALDGEFVVGLRDETTSKRAFVELVGLGEGMRWQAMVPGYQVPDGAIGVAAAEHAITVRFPRDGRTQLFGFASQSARKLGSMILGDDLATEPDGHLGATVATLSGGKHSFEILEPDGGPARIYAIAIGEGRLSWQRDLPKRGIEAIWVTNDQVVVEQPGAVTALARADGAATTHPWEHGCVVPGSGGRDDLLVEAPRCGRRRDRVHTIAAGATAITDDTGARIELGAPIDTTAPAAAPDAIPFSGDLPRHVPVVVAGADGARIAGVDLDGHRVAWQTAPSEALRGVRLLDAGGRVLLRVGDDLVSFDPETGAARAVRVPDTRPLQPHHVAGGLVWIVGRHGLAALDVATLAVRGTWRSGPRVEPAPGAPAGLGFAAATAP